MKQWILVLALWSSFAAADSVPDESRFLSGIRQLTFSGERSGEGYFSADGKQMVFQSEREPGNPFYQIYLLDISSGKIQKISNGVGKTTCSWIHPKQAKVLFSSTHTDPNSSKLQKVEIETRKSGNQRRYAWDYDEHFDLYVKDLKTGKLSALAPAATMLKPHIHLTVNGLRLLPIVTNMPVKRWLIIPRTRHMGWKFTS
jgi:hypothetical protein